MTFTALRSKPNELKLTGCAVASNALASLRTTALHLLPFLCPRSPIRGPRNHIQQVGSGMAALKPIEDVCALLEPWESDDSDCRQLASPAVMD